jgi:hypothetical protein
MDRIELKSIIAEQRGSTLVFVAICIFMILALTALAVDIGHLVVTKNELQNAADAGALAGARFLYNSNGTEVNTDANRIAYEAGIVNTSDGSPAEINWSSGMNIGSDVERGHWSFGLGNLARGFYPSDATDPVELWNASTEDLDENTDFINAVRVMTRRETTPTVSYFAKILGFQGFTQTAEAVAYIGYAGSLMPAEADQPIAICEESLLLDGLYQCNTGRMLNSGSDSATHNTAAWTNFSQPCETANANEMRSLICGGGNPEPVEYNQGMGAVGGVQNSVLSDLIDCWQNGLNDTNGDGVGDFSVDTDGDGIPDEPWNLTLPVIECPGNNVSNCSVVKGAVNLNVVWITGAGTPDWDDAPYRMGDWASSDSDGQERWNSFVEHFNLKNVDDMNATYAQKSIYFLPDCTPHERVGTSEGQNFGILAEIPVLVD